MKKYISFLILSVLLSFSKVSFADVCSSDPSCDNLGYHFTASECSGKPSIQCPFDSSYLYCNRLNWKPCEIGDVYDSESQHCLKSGEGDYVVIQTTAAGTCRIIERSPHLFSEKYPNLASTMTAQVIGQQYANLYCTSYRRSQTGISMTLPYFSEVQILLDSGKMLRDERKSIKYVTIVGSTRTVSNSDGTSTSYYYPHFSNLDVGTVETVVPSLRYAQMGLTAENFGGICVSQTLVPCESTKANPGGYFIGTHSYVRSARAGTYLYSGRYALSPSLFYSVSWNLLFMTPSTAYTNYIITSKTPLPMDAVFTQGNNFLNGGGQVFAAPVDNPVGNYQGTTPITYAYSWAEAMEYCESQGGRLVTKEGVAGYIYALKRSAELMTVTATKNYYQNRFYVIGDSVPPIFYARGEDEYGNVYPACYDYESAVYENMYAAEDNLCPDYMDEFTGSVICEFPFTLREYYYM